MRGYWVCLDKYGSQIGIGFGDRRVAEESWKLSFASSEVSFRYLNEGVLTEVWKPGSMIGYILEISIPVIHGVAISFADKIEATEAKV
jgi:hypothetical protein